MKVPREFGLPNDTTKYLPKSARIERLGRLVTEDPNRHIEPAAIERAGKPTQERVSRESSVSTI
jgi:hypothetical protein